ncbi:MAG: hypothetical protein KJZ93_28495 [Caldilineaceae bacterium]|nr:hypothetical protein [Caldilineaceae bacterium]
MEFQHVDHQAALIQQRHAELLREAEIERLLRARNVDGGQQGAPAQAGEAFSLWATLLTLPARLKLA